MMQVFHTSPLRIEKPQVNFSRDYLDFGKGFYLTTLRQQAVSYGARFKLRGKPAVLNCYILNEDLLATCRTKEFVRYDGEWLDFVLACRTGKDQSDWDVVLGPIADDKVFRTLDLYFSGEMSREEALRQLDPMLPNNQICIRRQEVLDKALCYTQSEIL